MEGTTLSTLSLSSRNNAELASPFSPSRKKKGSNRSRIKIYHESLFKELAGDQPIVGRSKIRSDDSTMLSTRTLRRAKIQAQKREKEHMEELRQRRLRQHMASLKAIEEENKRVAQEKIEKETLRRESAFQAQYKRVMEGQVLSKEVKKMIQLADEAAHIKSIKLYEDWNDTVFGFYERKIEEEVKKMNYHRLNQRRNDAYDQFLDQTNTKACIFRDIIIESEYDPLQLNRQSIKVKSTKRLKDPTLRATQRTEEENAVLANISKPRQPLGKQTLDTRMWGTGVIESTPHGYFAKMMKEKPNEDESAPSAKLRRSSLVFDHYNITD